MVLVEQFEQSRCFGRLSPPTNSPGSYARESCYIQVEHHPPTVALYSEGKYWTMWQEFAMTTKFRANYVHLIPSGQSLSKVNSRPTRNSSSGDELVNLNLLTTISHTNFKSSK